MSFPQMLALIMKERSVSAYRLSKDLAVSPSSVRNWLDGKTTPSAEVIQRLADYFEVSTDYLLGKESPGEETIVFDDLSYAMYGGMKELDDEHKEMMVDYMKYLLAKQKEKEQKKE
mgnify:CR=1 FL=1